MPTGTLPPGWEQLRFPSIQNETMYTLHEVSGEVVLRADSRASASALITRVDIDPAEYPEISWSWKAGNSCFVGNWDDAPTDDFPVRLFVLFEQPPGLLSLFRRDSGMSGDVILYVPRPAGIKEEPQGTTSHLSSRIRIVPVSGQSDQRLGWTALARNVSADYVSLFGRVPRKIKGIAVMSDTDNSDTSCVSFFGDIAFSNRS